MKYPDFLELTSLLDDDILLVHQASTMTLKKIKLSTLKQYIGVSGGGSVPSNLPNPVDGYVKWFRFDSITLSGNDVLAIKDKSLNANHLAPIGATPTLVSDAINGRNAIKFQNSGLKTQAESYAAKTIYMVFRNLTNTFSTYNGYLSYRANNANVAAASNELLLIGGVPGTNQVTGEAATGVYLDNIPGDVSAYSNYTSGIPIGDVGQFHLIENICSTSTVGIKTLCVGIDVFENARTLVNSDIAEIIIYPNLLSSSDRVAMNTYFKSMYNFSFL